VNYLNVEVNYLAVLLAGIASMVLGFLWYSPYLLGNMWMKEKGLSKESMKANQKEMGKLYGLSFLFSLVTAYVLSHVMSLSEFFFGYPILQTGITTAIWMWLGFVLPVQVTATIFGSKNWKLLGIDTGYQLVSLLLMAVVLALV
jgi:hypothetical protein